MDRTETFQSSKESRVGYPTSLDYGAPTNGTIVENNDQCEDLPDLDLQDVTAILPDREPDEEKSFGEGMEEDVDENEDQSELELSIAQKIMQITKVSNRRKSMES